MLISIITPTIGSPYLKDLLISINKQFGLSDKMQIEHFIVIDNGLQNSRKVYEVLDEVPENEFVRRYILTLPFHSGKDNFKGHKIYSSIPQFTNGDYISFLDEDNIIASYHFSQFYQIIENEVFDEYDWFYSLRFICDSSGKAIYPDLCESLGFLNNCFYNDKSYLIDTNNYFVKANICKNICNIWNKPANYNDSDPDRIYGKLLMTHFPKYKCINNFSVKYRIESKERIEMFMHGNEIIKAQYGTNNIFQYPILYLAHFNKEKTDELIKRIYSHDLNISSVCFKQYQINLLDKFVKKNYFIKNAYSSPFIPSKSIVLVHMCNPQDLPIEVLQRKDLFKILSTFESPNLRHKEQWEKRFIHTLFTHVITFWEDLINDENIIYYPFSSRFDMTNINDIMMIQDAQNFKKDNSCCILLENRPFNVSYKIDDIELHSLDYKRLESVKLISQYLPFTCYGKSWRYVANDVKNVTFVDTPDRFLDEDKNIDYYKKHKFCLVIENCDAKGYVSEKIYDVWACGSIPIYHGNFSDKLKKFFGKDTPLEDMYIKLEEFEEVIKDDKRINLILQNIQKYKENILCKIDIQCYADKLDKVYKDIFFNKKPIYYSQFGEDKYINEKYFKNSSCLTYFEAGAMDGVKYSNTKFFENTLGWKGILVEPNPTNYEKLKVNRGKNNKIFNCLISDNKDELEFIYSDEVHSAVSCVKDTMPKDHDKNYFDHIDSKIIKIKPRTLTSIIEESGFKTIDFFVLDVEGHELNVLKSFNFSICKIKLFMIENLENNDNDKECQRILTENGFVFLERYHINDIYIYKEFIQK
jgi:FkbM family methyltransferase